NNCILTAVKKFNPGKTFFDIGGGNGFVAKHLENNGVTTVLIEPGLTGCRNAKNRGLNHVVCSTLEEAEFKKETLPSVGLFDVVEHIENDLAFLQLIHEYMQTKGKVFITVPAFQFLWSNEDVDAGHYRRYSIAQLSKTLEQAGFKVVYSSYIFSILPIAVFLFRSLPSKLGFNKNSNDVSKHKNEHQEKPGLINSILQKIWQYEVNSIAAAKKIGIGGSCFIVAEKQ
ncbi:MAG: class I SAM-dependent methyltransferase, partial [Bacteroidia bacterium]|nr:class I SAM-dependent methyltransferase [Bacteroidia bacterium]